MVAIAKGGAKGTKDCIVVIGYLPAQQRVVVENLLQLVGLLAGSKA